MGNPLKIALGSDHGGFELKNQLLSFLRDAGLSVQDCGTHSKDAVDYPRIAYTVARLVASGECDKGIMIDGAGIGSPSASKNFSPRKAVRQSRRHRSNNSTSRSSSTTPSSAPTLRRPTSSNS